MALTRAKRTKLLHEACGYANLLEADKLASTRSAFGAHLLLGPSSAWCAGTDVLLIC
jgi:hypothetical protein